MLATTSQSINKTSYFSSSGTSSKGKRQSIADAQQGSQQSTPRGHSPKSKPYSIPTIDTATSVSRPDSKDKSREPTKSSLEVKTTSLRTKSGDTELLSASIGKPGNGNTESKSERSGTKSGKTERVNSGKSEKSVPRLEINGGGKGLSGTTSPNRSISPQYLEPPDPDVRLEQLVLNEEAMLDLRKRDREALKGYNAKVCKINYVFP